MIGGIIAIVVVIGFIVGVPYLIYRSLGDSKRKEEVSEKVKGFNGQLSNDLASALGGKKIVEVKLLGGGATNYKRGGVGGAIVGGMLGGGIGAAVGGMTPKGKGTQMVKFAIRYEDGSIEVKDVRPNSAEYRNLMKYVKWEDIG